MVDSVNSVSTSNILPVQEYEKYEYEFDIDGKKQMAYVEKAPNGRVTIKVSDGKDVKIINTDVQGLEEFNKSYKSKDILYSSKPQEKSGEQKEVCSSELAQILRSIALANMAIRSSANQRNIRNLATQQMILDQNNQMQNQMIQQQFQQQVMQDNYTAMQMTTPGMGMI